MASQTENNNPIDVIGQLLEMYEQDRHNQYGDDIRAIEATADRICDAMTGKGARYQKALKEIKAIKTANGEQAYPSVQAVNWLAGVYKKKDPRYIKTMAHIGHGNSRFVK